MRIVSLIPSGTEIVAALGLADKLVGRSHECDTPPGVERLPECTRPAFRTGGPSGEIDRQVRELLTRALTIYELDTEVLARLKPTHIVTQDQCEVCAVDLATVERAVAELAGGEARVISHQPQRLGDVWDDVVRTGAALGVDGTAVAQGLKDRVQAIAARAPERRPTVACVEWCDPLMTAGNWVPELVRLAGGEDLLGVDGGHSPTIPWAALETADPEVVVFMPCGYGLGRTRQDAEMLAARPEWGRLRAARGGAVYVTDGNQYFNRPGPRLVDSLEILAEILHPEHFDFGHRGVGWQPL